MYRSLSAHGNIRQLKSCRKVWNSEATELNEKALNTLRYRNQKVTADTFLGQHKENSVSGFH